MKKLLVLLAISFFASLAATAEGANFKFPEVKKQIREEQSNKYSYSEILPNIDSLVEAPKGENIKLMVFVSSSMPENLLRSYLSEVNKFGGTLVFNGLIEGSFIKTKKFCMSLSSSEKDEASMQINDEAFTKYNITSVPSIVLAIEKDCYKEQTCIELSDKVLGSVKLEYALREFAEKGETRLYAKKLFSGELK